MYHEVVFAANGFAVEGSAVYFLPFVCNIGKNFVEMLTGNFVTLQVGVLVVSAAGVKNNEVFVQYGNGMGTVLENDFHEIAALNIGFSKFQETGIHACKLYLGIIKRVNISFFDNVSQI
jgi:hypothetical protein